MSQAIENRRENVRAAKTYGEKRPCVMSVFRLKMRQRKIHRKIKMQRQNARQNLWHQNAMVKITALQKCAVFRLHFWATNCSFVFFISLVWWLIFWTTLYIPENQSCMLALCLWSDNNCIPLSFFILLIFFSSVAFEICHRANTPQYVQWQDLFKGKLQR